MKIITWNINSIRLRSFQINKLLKLEKPDILCLQECKSPSEDMPFDEFKKLGYIFSAGWGQKSYNGVAFISKEPFEILEKRDFLKNGDARHISLITRKNITIHNFYFPAGGDIPDKNLNKKFKFKLDYIKEVEKYFKSNKPTKSLLVGDLNIAPETEDVWDHRKLLNVVSHTSIEVDHLKKLADSGSWIDLFRNQHPVGKYFSWWSYRSRDWKNSNKGRRLDHIWVTKDIYKKSNCYILKETRDWEKVRGGHESEIQRSKLWIT